MDDIATKIITVEVQENGIIRRFSDGYLIGKLTDEIDFKLLDKRPKPVKQLSEVSDDN